MVGARRFELPTPCAQGRCATRLRYAPSKKQNQYYMAKELNQGFSTPIETCRQNLYQFFERLAPMTDGYLGLLIHFAEGLVQWREEK